MPYGRLGFKGTGTFKLLLNFWPFSWNIVDSISQIKYENDWQKSVYAEVSGNQQPCVKQHPESRYQHQDTGCPRELLTLGSQDHNFLNMDFCAKFDH